MSKIALKFGGTIDKFIGDGIMIFFGDPESNGIEDDARKCLEMALETQEKMENLKNYWGKNFGLREPLKTRIGINTGICTVGNFGSEDRLDYTAMGSTVNLASRLESLANPGSVNVSEETKLLVSEYFKFAKPKEVQVKGFLRKIRYFEVMKTNNDSKKIINLHGDGFNLQIDEGKLNKKSLDNLQTKLTQFSKQKFLE